MKYRKLGQTGLDVSILSYGASSLGSVFREINETEGVKTVHTAIDQGINLIDVSPYYGLTKAENVLGKALVDIPRDKYILSTKAGRFGENDFDFSKKTIIKSLEESLQRLGTDYVDILYLHDIEFGSYEEVMEEGIPALEELKKQGKIRFLGVTGLPLTIFDKVLSKVDLDVILSYCHYSLNDTSLLNLLPLLEEKQVGLVNASPLSMGLLNSRDVAKWHPADEEMQQLCLNAAEYCAKHGYDLAKLAIQYSTHNKSIPTTLVSTASVENITKNIKWTEEPIDEGILDGVLDILEPIHNRTWQSGTAEWNKRYK
ncbi:aldo/keto reductase [Saliterribacillus persicus]|uniref:Aryl-alcohol dehydrogenase-like predicted oxidoreductase n=1 Tax=Saliterribacillus persicus TaxID=930114 RepID=A0A368XE34_9BACI|nr:aldo/keto reductase [Saliterribacillus persicus]RCW64274.1 aryl-alcohol dehydrogenase-like predicted oxidoreductase [Saliterribacillus persicus]